MHGRGHRHDLGMFYQCSLPSMSLHDAGVQGLGRAVQAEPAAGRRPGDLRGRHARAAASTTQGELWNWISKIAQKGASTDTVKEVTLIACNAEGDPVQTWVLKNAYPSSYSGRGHGGRGHGRPHGAISIKYTDAKLDGKGGLTGTV